MLTLKRQSQRDKLKEAIRSAVEYLDEIAGDERLRGDVRSAIGHGRDAGDRIMRDLAADDVARRLANDRKLRKKVRVALDDLDSASDRVRRRKRHRLRNGLLVLGSFGAITTLSPKARRWIAGRMAGAPGGAVDVPMT